MNGSSIQDLLANVENFRPLPQGRNLSLAASVTKGQVAVQDMRKFESELMRFSTNPAARVKTWLEYLDWFDQTHPSSSQECGKMYRRALNDVLAEPSLDGCEDVVKIAYRLALTAPKPRLIFDDMYSKRKCIKLSLFWIKWAHLVEDAGDNNQALKIYKKALALPLDNTQIVESALKSFEERICCEVMRGDIQSGESEPARINLGQLKDGPSVPVDRASAVVPSSGLKESHQSLTDQSSSQRLVIKKAETKSKGLGVTAEGKVSLAHEKENNNPKSKWKGESLKTIGSSGTLSGPQIIIPEVDDDSVSTVDLMQELLEVKAAMSKLGNEMQNIRSAVQDTVSVQLGNLEHRLSQNSGDKKAVESIVRDTMYSVLQSDVLQSTLKEIVYDVISKRGVFKEISSCENRDSKDNTVEHIDGMKLNLSDECKGECLKVAEDNKKAETVDMTPLVSRSFNPLAYKNFTPASPATEDAAANLSGISHLEAIDE